MPGLPPKPPVQTSTARAFTVTAVPSCLEAETPATAPSSTMSDSALVSSKSVAPPGTMNVSQSTWNFSVPFP